MRTYIRLNPHPYILIELSDIYGDRLEVATDNFVIPKGLWVPATVDLRRRLEGQLRKLDGSRPAQAKWMRTREVLEKLNTFLTSQA